MCLLCKECLYDFNLGQKQLYLRIFTGIEGQIKHSVIRVAVQHLKALSKNYTM